MQEKLMITYLTVWMQLKSVGNSPKTVVLFVVFVFSKNKKIACVEVINE